MFPRFGILYQEKSGNPAWKSFSSEVAEACQREVVNGKTN
jgi:hypothetical protein